MDLEFIKHKNFFFDTVDQLNKNITKTACSFSLKILQINIRGMNNLSKFDSIKEFLDRYAAEIDVLVVGETWVQSDRTNLFKLNGYKSIFSCRPDSAGGGLAVYIRESIIFDELGNVQENGFHHIHVRLDAGGTPFHVHAMYRPPSYDSATFFKSLESLLEASKNNQSHVIVGDINVPTNRIESNVTNEYINLLKCYNFAVTNTYPTRPVSNNILDHVVCSDALLNFTVNETIFTDCSDHNFVLSTFNLQKTVMRRTLSKTITNYTKLNEAFKTATECMPQGTAVERLVYVLDLYERLKTKYSRTVQVGARIKGHCPWMTFDLWKWLRMKDNVLRRQRKRPHDVSLRDLVQYVSRRVQQMKNQCKRDYYDNVLRNADQRSMWSNLNEILGLKNRDNSVKIDVDGQLTTHGPTVADRFNKFFSSIGPQLASSISSNRDIKKFGTLNPLQNSIYLSPATVQEVVLRIKELDPSKSCGLDGIHATFLKTHHVMFSMLLRDVFNECILTGRYPDCLKTARVVPVYKTGSRSDTNNYRPISVLSVLSKILEQLLVKRMTCFFNQHDVLYSHQYGFRTGSSTLTAMCELTDDIYKALDSRNIMGVLFLDLKKAFDTIDYEVLLQKLDSYGVRGTANDLIRSYLTGRTQCVVINDATSTRCPLTVGVPQGSNLGPLLFLIYVNDLARLKLHGKPRLFADDTSLSYQAPNPESAVQQMKEDMLVLQDYFNENLLSLNLTKTKYVLFHSSRVQPSPHEELIVNGIVLEKVPTFRYLGLTIDATLSWGEHINKLQRDLSSVCGILWKAAKFLPPKQLCTMYHAFIQSKLQYMVSIWGAASKSRLKILQRVQNRCLKIVYRKPRLYSTVCLYTEASPSVLPIPALRELQCLTQMHKLQVDPFAHHNQSFTTVTHGYVLRNQGVLSIRRPRTESMKRSFKYFGKQRYNQLPTILRTQRNIRDFKKQLRLRIRQNLQNYIV